MHLQRWPLLFNKLCFQKIEESFIFNGRGAKNCAGVCVFMRMFIRPAQKFWVVYQDIPRIAECNVDGQVQSETSDEIRDGFPWFCFPTESTFRLLFALAFEFGSSFPFTYALGLLATMHVDSSLAFLIRLSSRSCNLLWEAGGTSACLWSLSGSRTKKSTLHVKLECCSGGNKTIQM